MSSRLTGAPQSRGGIRKREETQLNNIPPYDEISNEPVNVPWQDNTLSSLENPAYHLTLFMISDDDMVKVGQAANVAEAVRALEGKVIIAETGSTAINIARLEFKTKIAPSDANRTTIAFDATMKLFEPMGMSLFDKILSASAGLGVRNYFKTGYFLEIKFHGYDTQGNYQDNVGPGDERRTWIYRMVITNIVSEFTAAGTFYEVSMKQYDDLGSSDAFYRLEAPFNPQSTTVRDIVQELVDAKREEEIANYGYQRNIFEVQFLTLDPVIGDLNVQGLVSSLDPADWSFVGNSPSRSNEKDNVSDPSKVESNFSRGQSFESILENIYTNTAEGQALTRRSNVPRQYGKDSEFVVIWWIVPKVELREDDPYDWRLNDYNRRITYYVTPYVSVRGIGTPSQQVAIQKRDTEEMQKKFQVRKTAQRMRKRYDYLFTGLNTEVINVDIKFDYLWRALIPMFGGNNVFGLHTPGPIESEDDFLSRQALLNDLYSRINTLDAQIKNLTNDLNSENLSAEDRRKLEVRRNILSAQLRVRQEDRETTRVQINDFAEARRIERKKLVALPKRAFVEDLPILNVNNFLPVSIDKSGKQASQDGRGNVLGDDALEQSMSTAIINQITSRSLSHINLSIRGDPYWLGFTHLDTPNYLTNRVYNPDMAAFNTGEYLFLLTFNIPKGIDEESGAPEIIRNEAYTALYLALEINNLFDGGNFTQEIHAIRDANIDINVLAL